MDYSARIQIAAGKFNAGYYKLIKAFDERTGCPVIINASFNRRGEPIVCSPEDVYRCFMETEMDTLVMEDLILQKTKQPLWREKAGRRSERELD